MSNLLKLDCQACKQEKSMVPTKVSRMSPVVVLIGWLIAIPSIIGVIIAVIVFITMVLAGGGAAAEAVTEAEKAGATMGAGIGMMVSFVIGAGSLIGGLLGYVLIMKKKVFKCTACGFILDRA